MNADPQEQDADKMVLHHHLDKASSEILDLATKCPVI